MHSPMLLKSPGISISPSPDLKKGILKDENMDLTFRAEKLEKDEFTFYKMFYDKQVASEKRREIF